MSSFSAIFLALSQPVLTFGLQHPFAQLLQGQYPPLLSRSCDLAKDAKLAIKGFQEQGVPAKYFLKRDFGRFALSRTDTSKILAGPGFVAMKLRAFLDWEYKNSFF